MMFSEEINNAIKFGYKFEILRGYIFNVDQIFTKYVQDMFSIKQNSLKTDAMYLISKLLLNSLFGRFALHYNLGHTVVVGLDIFDQMFNEDSLIIENFNDFNDGFYLVTYKTRSGNEGGVVSKDNRSKSSISVSAAITAYARIYMSQFKKPDQDFNLFYTDTDSIFIDKPLFDHLIGKELGEMKLEYILKKAVFLASKVYVGKIQSQDKKICKIKGYKDKVKIKDLEKLLLKTKN